MLITKYTDRQHAGQTLAALLQAYKNNPDVIILALPRGGVPVAYEIAHSLHVPLDVFIVRKLGVPGHEELALGAIAMYNTVFYNQEIINYHALKQADISAVLAKEQAELQRRQAVYRRGRPPLYVTNKIIILVDDGIATGATMKVAIQALQQQQPKALIVAVPVADPQISIEIAAMVDAYYCPLQPKQLNAVGAWYENFLQTEDTEVFDLLRRQT